MSVFLDGIAAQFYRGIGAEVQFIGPFSRMNFFIGANNAGKSVVLGLLAEQLKQVTSGQNVKPLTGPDIHTSRENGQFMIAMGRRSEMLAEALCGPHENEYFRVQHGGYPSPTFRGQIQELLEKLSILGIVWVRPNGHQPPEVYPAVDVGAAKAWIAEWQSVWSLLTGQGSGGYNYWIPETLRVVAQHVIEPLRVCRRLISVSYAAMCSASRAA